MGRLSGPGRAGPRLLKMRWVGPGRDMYKFDGPVRAVPKKIENVMARSGRGPSPESLMGRAGPRPIL